MKTAIFLVIAIAALGGIGVTTAFMSSAIPAHAQLYPQPFHCNAQPPQGEAPVDIQG